MKFITRYTIPADGKHHTFDVTHMPGHVGNSLLLGEVDFWAITDSECVTHTIEFTVIGTGDEIPAGGVWVGSVDPVRGNGVRHLFAFPGKELYRDLTGEGR